MSECSKTVSDIMNVTETSTSDLEQRGFPQRETPTEEPQTPILEETSIPQRETLTEKSQTSIETIKKTEIDNNIKTEYKQFSPAYKQSKPYRTVIKAKVL